MGRIRYVCRDCNRAGRGGYFSVKGEAKSVKCPYCSSKNVKVLG